MLSARALFRSMHGESSGAVQEIDLDSAVQNRRALAAPGESICINNNNPARHPSTASRCPEPLPCIPKKPTVKLGRRESYEEKPDAAPLPLSCPYTSPPSVP